MLAKLFKLGEKFRGFGEFHFGFESKPNPKLALDLATKPSPKLALDSVSKPNPKYSVISRSNYQALCCVMLSKVGF